MAEWRSIVLTTREQQAAAEPVGRFQPAQLEADPIARLHERNNLLGPYS